MSTSYVFTHCYEKECHALYILFKLQICETTESERVQHVKELFLKYGEMFEGVIPQLQQVCL